MSRGLHCTGAASTSSEREKLVRELLHCATAILQGGIDDLSGCRTIVRLMFELGDEERNDDLFHPFEGIESEMDGFPVGKERSFWNREALERKDGERLEYMQRVRPKLERACTKLIEEYATLQ